MKDLADELANLDKLEREHDKHFGARGKRVNVQEMSVFSLVSTLEQLVPVVSSLIENAEQMLKYAKRSKGARILMNRLIKNAIDWSDEAGIMFNEIGARVSDGRMNEEVGSRETQERLSKRVGSVMRMYAPVLPGLTNVVGQLENLPSVR